MNKKSTVLILLLAVSMISMIPLLSTKNVVAEPVTSSNTPIIQWFPDTGFDDAQSLLWNPEYLQVHTISTVPSNTTIIVQGKDTYGQNIEASAQLNGTCANPVGSEQVFMLNDIHSGQPVAFAQITGVFQQNGAHNVQLLIETVPEPFEEYLGEWHLSTGWLPGEYRWGASDRPLIYGPTYTKYLVGTGEPQSLVKTQPYPVEPSNPDPIKIVLNWHERDGDLLPESSDFDWKASNSKCWIWFEGLDEKGNKLEANVTIPKGVKSFDFTGCHTWSTICKVDGNGTESYYIFTEPIATRPLFYYNLLIDHMTIQPDCYDILANPGTVDSTGRYPGRTNITVTLRDKDGNLIHSSGNIVVNFATSGGKIFPSSDVWIRPCNVSANVTLWADTNARTVNVTADANVPKCTTTFVYPEMNLFAWTEMTFDGINSVGTQWTSIHMMMWGYHTEIGGQWQTPYTAPVPPKPIYFPGNQGGPVDEEETRLKLDGPIYEVMIPLFTGCNLISSPVHPILCNTYMSGYGSTPWPFNGIPMSLLFGNTSATTCIEVVWWYCNVGSKWYHYVPGVDTEGYFTDGVGYWVYAEKPCTLEISGVSMENAQFTPSVYPLKANAWNLVGFTSITPMSINNYLESINSGATSGYLSAAGPLWTYYAYNGYWFRNPSWGLYPGYGFWIYNKVPTTLYIAP
jgi:hypothetical protein